MTETITEYEQVLEQLLAGATGEDCPQGLAQALRYAVFPGGARVRPKLCVAVAAANGAAGDALAATAGAAIELLHCASLVHDDLPCFDNSDERRGKPTVHVAFGEQRALLAGDALIVMAFEALATVSTPHLERMPQVLALVARGVSAPHGITAGQAWECESEIDLSRYHQSKTGALFVAATCAGAAAAGVDPAPWMALGQSIGESYQVADDIHDAIGDAETLGKPAGQDVLHDRPSAVQELGLDGAIARLRELVEIGVESVPACVGQQPLQTLVRHQARRFLPKHLARRAA